MQAERVFHVLSVPRRDHADLDARGTVRAGTIAPGDTLWYATPEGERHELHVAAVESGERHMFLRLRGDEKSVASLAGGYYLFGR